MKHYIYTSMLTLVFSTACNPTDRSNEQPFPPTIKPLSAVSDGWHAHLTGEVTSSPTSRLSACGFKYGNDTLRLETTADIPEEVFTVLTDSLGAGRYYAVPFARNGVGTSLGDTIYFQINEP